MPQATPTLTIEVAAGEPAPPGTWIIIVSVRIRDVLSGETAIPETGSVKVELIDIEEATGLELGVLDTKYTDDEGKVMFSGVGGAFYMLGFWKPNKIKIRATHIPTGAKAEKVMILDSQIPETGVFKWWWEPFPYSESERTWSDPPANSEGTNSIWDEEGW